MTTIASQNPYSATACDDTVSPIIVDTVRCRTTRFWPTRTLSLFEECLKIDTLAIKLDQITAIESRKRFPGHLSMYIRFAAGNAYESAEFSPRDPKAWYEQFERLGLETNDAHDYRNSWQIGQKIDDAILLAEVAFGCILLIAFVAACLGGVLSR